MTLPVARGRRWWPAARRLRQPQAFQGAHSRRRAEATPIGHARRRRVRQEQSLGDEVYCWLRPQKSSSAEVDYLVASGGRAVPIEVKSGPAGRLRSLHLLLREYPQCAPGLVLSEAPHAELPQQGLVFVPLYYAGALIGPAAGR